MNYGTFMLEKPKCTKSLISLKCIATKAQQISDVFEIFCLKQNTSITVNVQCLRNKKLKRRMHLMNKIN
jgi:hypothetical protein